MSLFSTFPAAFRSDDRGSLIAVEDFDLPFSIKRVYTIVHPVGRRGDHAHQELWQGMVCLTGSCTLHFDDGRKKESIHCDDSSVGYLIPPGIWHHLDEFAPQSVFLLLASDHYTEDDYFRTYDDFRAWVSQENG